MASGLEDLARRKQALINRAAQERDEVARNYANLKSPFAVTSWVSGIGSVLKTYPIVAAGLSSLLASGYAGKALRSSGHLLPVLKLALPIWSWVRNRGKK